MYGDTDSLFVNGAAIDDLDIVSMAKEKFQVDFTRDKVWKILVLMKNKKHLITQETRMIPTAKRTLPESSINFLSVLIQSLVIELFR